MHPVGHCNAAVSKDQFSLYILGGILSHTDRILKFLRGQLNPSATSLSAPCMFKRTGKSVLLATYSGCFWGAKMSFQ